MFPLFIGFAFLILSIVFFWLSSTQRKGTGLPTGRIIYTDTRAWGTLEKPLFDPVLVLTGKPDYLVEQSGRIIPVEVKSGRAPVKPYDSHIFQLAAYCYLVDKTYGKRPLFGIIHYSGRDFAVDYTPALESTMLDVLAQIRRDEQRADVPRSHEVNQRCARCGFRRLCDQRLV